MSKKEKLILLLEAEKMKLETKKSRFDKWQQQLSEKIEKFKGTLADFDKGLLFWRKSRRLAERIYVIEDKILALQK